MTTRLLNLANDNTEPSKPQAFKPGDRVTVGGEAGTIWEVRAHGYVVGLDYTQGRRASFVNLDADPPMLLERSGLKTPPLESDLGTEQRTIVRILERLSNCEARFNWDWQGNTCARASYNGVEWVVDPVGSVGLMLEIGSGMRVSLHTHSSDTPGVQVHWETDDGRYGAEAVKSAYSIAQALLETNQLKHEFADLLKRAQENDNSRTAQCAQRISEAFYRELEGLPYLLQVSAKRQALELIQQQDVLNS